MLGQEPCVLDPLFPVESRVLAPMDFGAVPQKRGQGDLGGGAVRAGLLHKREAPPAPAHDRKERQPCAIGTDSGHQAGGVGPGLHDRGDEVRPLAGKARGVGLPAAAAQHVGHVDHQLVCVVDRGGRLYDELTRDSCQGCKVLGDRLGSGSFCAGIVETGGLDAAELRATT